MEKDTIKRIELKFNLAYKEDKEVYKILEKKRNKNDYIRQAVLYLAHGTSLDPVVEAAIEKVLTTTVRKELPDVIKEIFTEQMKEVLRNAPVEPTVSEPSSELPEEVIPDELPEENNPEDNLDLTGIEDLF